MLKYFFFILIVILIVDTIYSPINRYFLSRKNYQFSRDLADRKGKKLIVVGDPCVGNGIFMKTLQKYYPNCKHGDITIDLNGCNECMKMNINNLESFKKFKDSKYVVFETGTFGFANNMRALLKEIKRISGGDFISAGGTNSLFWKYIGHKLYSMKYRGNLNYMIYPFNGIFNKKYLVYNLKSNQMEKIDF